MTHPAETRTYEDLLSDIEQSAYLRGHAAAMSTCRACKRLRPYVVATMAILTLITPILIVGLLS